MSSSSLRFPKLSLPNTEIECLYDVIVVGSGYGASIAASRYARAGQTVCVLEKGAEWLPGDFPELPETAPSYFRVTCNGKELSIGEKGGLYDVIINDDITVVKGCGLGGTSLINANVYLNADPRVFEKPVWPDEIREDMETMMSYDRKHFEQMMRPTVYPDKFPQPKKLDAMRLAAEGLLDIEDSYKVARKVPLFVNFDQEKSESTKYRFDQPACNGCGNCCSGCNTGAKQTLNMNYLPDAKCHGASIFTNVSVVSVSKDPHDAALWQVHYERNDKKQWFFTNEQVIKAKYVILGAGAIGSTQILLQSKERGLEISDAIGTRFSGNGDALGYSFHGKNKVNSIGMKTGKYPKATKDSPGPCITSVIDLRGIPNQKLEDGMVLEDGTPPGAAYWAMLAASMVLVGNPINSVLDPVSEWHKLAQKLKDTSLDKTLSFLAMSHDDSSGKITLHPKARGPIIEWNNVGYQEIFHKIDKRMREMTEKLGGDYMANPVWSNMMHKGVVTVHPLGGCPMGKHGGKAVVNHKGQVFIGGSDDVYNGLYVMDGSIIPTSVGVNPICTISLLAERCCRLLIEEAGWEIDYETFQNFNNINDNRSSVGLRFSEKMKGALIAKETNQTIDCEFSITIESDDVENMLEHDPTHLARVSGILTCSLLSDEAMTISYGLFNLFEKSKDHHDTKEMTYSFVLTSSKNEQYHFEGKKYIKSRGFFDTGLEDTTTLFVKIFDAEKRNIVAEGVLKIHLDDFLQQLQTIEITNTNSGILKAKWLGKFGKFFAGTLFKTYCPLSKFIDTTTFPSNRKRRELKLNGVTPKMYNITTEDNVSLHLTRFQGGDRGPLLAIHGLGVSSEIFCHDTIPTNFVEYFVGHEYDVWLLDSRMSIACPEVFASNAHTLDHLIFFDNPAAVQKVIEVTKKKKVNVFAHCAGALTFWGSMAYGLLNGMIDSIIFSQVTPISKGQSFNVMKGKLGLSKIFGIFGQKTVNPHSLFLPSLPFWKQKDHCNNKVCMNVSLMYGLLYEHSNLTVATHDAICELFGEASLKYLNHLSQCFRNGKLVEHNGHDVYFFGIDSNGKTKAKVPWMDNFDVPIQLFYGRENQSYEEDGIKRMHALLRNIHPKQHYEVNIVDGYGHIDGIIGKRACRDVWPHLLAFFEKHSDIPENCQLVLDQYMNAIEKLKLEHCSTIDKSREGYSDENDMKGDEVDNQDAFKIPAEPDRTDMGKIYGSELGFIMKMTKMTMPVPEYNLTPTEEKEIEQLKKVLPMVEINRWPTARNKGRFHNKPKYSAKQGDMVEEVSLKDEQTDRRIFVLSDMHFGSSWTSNNIDRLHIFTKLLAKCAKQHLHTLVLLGDIFDMWGTPINKRPQTKEAMSLRWMDEKRFRHFVLAVKVMADHDDVKVYYIPGNHDFQITHDMVRNMFGENVKFVAEGKLVLVIQTDHGQTYTVRFEHGHHHDMFNSADFLIKQRPIGYYVSRCQQSLSDCGLDTPTVMQRFLTKLLEYMPSVIGSIGMHFLTNKHIQKSMIKHIFEVALEEKSVDDNRMILLENDDAISIGELCSYPLVTKAVEKPLISGLRLRSESNLLVHLGLRGILKFGHTQAFCMLQASMAIYDDILKKMNEDVIVMGHTHIFKNFALNDEIGEAIYANSGTWVDIGSEFSYAVINPPAAEVDGTVEVSHDKHAPVCPRRNFTLF